MASTTLPAEARPGIVAPALPFLVAAALYVVLLAAGDGLLHDADTYWHIASGRWILANGFPHADPFSFTFFAKPWIAKEWLSQIVFAEAYAVAGWTAVVVVSAAAMAFAFGVLTRALREYLAPLPALALVAVAFMLAAPHATARPHLLALPVMVAWAAALLRAADRHRAPSYSVALLMVLWANLHAGFTFGILLVAAFGLDAVASAERPERYRLALAWLRFGLLTLIAGCFTPYGPQSMLVTLKVLGLGPALSIIGEWKPANFAAFGPLELALLGGLGLALWRGFTLPPVRVLILLGVLHMALSADRNAEILGLVAPLVIAVPLARQFATLRADSAPAASAIGAAFAALVVPATAAFATFASYQPPATNTPVAAVAAVKAADGDPVLNDYDFGGYLIFSGVPTFIDGRTELYGGDFTAQYYRAVTLADLDGFVKMLDANRIKTTLLTAGTPANALLDRLPGWQRLYADDVAVVHIRTPLRPTLP
ncbi:MAG TPA: hypothetical protein VHA70_10705 [Bauldia sp.]|nr:hypothetical protein [Bauldia sp.]